MHPLPEGRQGHEGRLTALLEGAIANLERNRAQVNELNVFPVADGDTGENLLATLRAFRDGGAHGVEPEPEPELPRPKARPLSRHRWCTNVAAYGDVDARVLQAMGDSVMVVRDDDLVRVHVHTDDPDAVVALFEDVVDVDVSDMLPATTAFALTDGGFDDLFASMGVRTTGELRPFHAGSVLLVAEPQAALVAAVALDPERGPEENSAALLEAIARVRTRSVPEGGELAPAVRELAQGAELLTIITGKGAPLGDEEIRALVPAEVELEVTPGAPAPWWWLLAAE